MRARSINAVLAAAAALLMVAGCSDSQPGAPTAMPTAGEPTNSSVPSNEPSTPAPTNRYGAPRVASPLDATTFLTQPCAALTPQQLRDLDMPVQGKPDTDSAVAKHSGPGCGWTNSDLANGIGVSFTTGNKNGLADLYRARGEGKWTGYWEETTVDGYPGVFHGTTDLRSRGDCALAVGISDSLAFLVSEVGQLKEKSCDFAQQVAAAVVETLKRGG